jgi:hypothetical protein
LQHEGAGVLYYSEVVSKKGGGRCVGTTEWGVRRECLGLYDTVYSRMGKEKGDDDLSINLTRIVV